MASLLVPVFYLSAVMGGLFIFSFFYRKRAAQKVIDPYFPPHHERNTYVTLLQRTDPPTPEHILKAALLCRAAADVRRVMRLREDKPALQNLLQKGSVGDDLWTSFLAAEKETEAEIVEVVGEANTFTEGWGQFIFASASEIIATEKMRSVFEKLPQARRETDAKFGVEPTGVRDIDIPSAALTVGQPTVAPSSQPQAGPSSVNNKVDGTSSKPPVGPLSTAPDSSPSSDGEDKSPTNPSAKSGKKATKKRGKKK